MTPLLSESSFLATQTAVGMTKHIGGGPWSAIAPTAQLFRAPR
jgi:hypothetical protein